VVNIKLLSVVVSKLFQIVGKLHFEEYIERVFVSQHFYVGNLDRMLFFSKKLLVCFSLFSSWKGVEGSLNKVKPRIVRIELDIYGHWHPPAGKWEKF